MKNLIENTVKKIDTSKRFDILKDNVKKQYIKGEIVLWKNQIQRKYLQTQKIIH